MTKRYLEMLADAHCMPLNSRAGPTGTSNGTPRFAKCAAHADERTNPTIPACARDVVPEERAMLEPPRIEPRVTGRTRERSVTMRQDTVIQALARAIGARLNCIKSDNAEWRDRHAETITHLVRDYLPSGSGWDHGTRLDFDRSTSEKVILYGAYHHMTNGGYDGYTDHEVIITPSLAFGFHLRITGRDRNAIKEYLADLFHEALSATVAPATKVDA